MNHGAEMNSDRFELKIVLARWNEIAVTENVDEKNTLGFIDLHYTHTY